MLVGAKGICLGLEDQPGRPTQRPAMCGCWRAKGTLQWVKCHLGVETVLGPGSWPPSEVQ